MAEENGQPSMEELYRRVLEVAVGYVGTIFGNALPDDDRPAFLRQLLNDSIIARAESAATTRLLYKLGITTEEWLAVLGEELSAELERLKSD